MHDRSCRLRLGQNHLGTYDNYYYQSSCRSQPSADNHLCSSGSCSYLSPADDSYGNSRNRKDRYSLVRFRESLY